MTAAEVAMMLGGARPEGNSWRCRCPLHGGRSLIVRDGKGGRILATCWGGCDRLAVLAELRRLNLLGGPAEYDALPYKRLRDDSDHGADKARRIDSYAGEYGKNPTRPDHTAPADYARSKSSSRKVRAG